MQVRLLYFAGCREAAGRSEEHIQLHEGATVGHALAWLEAERPAVSKHLRAARVAVNREFVQGDHALRDGDELALIPPVSGGAGQKVHLTHEPIEREAAAALLSTEGAGAVLTFGGVVRPTSKQGRPVTHLDYEAYEPMALDKLGQCLREAGERWPLLDAAVIHRLGHLTLGDVAVSIAVATRHRKEAFEACAFVIDRLKEIVPIWKKETGPDGAEWVSEGA